MSQPTLRLKHLNQCFTQECFNDSKVQNLLFLLQASFHKCDSSQLFKDHKGLYETGQTLFFQFENNMFKRLFRMTTEKSLKGQIIFILMESTLKQEISLGDLVHCKVHHCRHLPFTLMLMLGSARNSV